MLDNQNNNADNIELPESHSEKETPHQIESDEQNLMSGKDEVKLLIKRAQSGDHTAIPKLRQYMKDNPCLWVGHGDLARQSQKRWINFICGPDLYLRESIIHNIRNLKQMLSEESPTATEELAIDRIVSTWLQLYYYEVQETETKYVPIELEQFRFKKMCRAQDQHMKAIAALETLRRLSPKPLLVTTPQAALLDVTHTTVEKNNGSRNPEKQDDLFTLLHNRSLLPPVSCNGNGHH